jgi:hypothetical protein
MKNKDPHLLSNLPAYSEEGAVHAVVEAPKGSLVKLKYEIKLGAFTVAHSLPLGLSYRLTGDLFLVRKLLMAIHWIS